MAVNSGKSSSTSQGKSPAKSPMDYFGERDFSVTSQEKDLSPAERAFLRKYLGVEDAAGLAAAIPALSGSAGPALGPANDASAFVASFVAPIEPDAAGALVIEPAEPQAVSAVSAVSPVSAVTPPAASSPKAPVVTPDSPASAAFARSTEDAEPIPPVAAPPAPQAEPAVYAADASAVTPDSPAGDEPPDPQALAPASAHAPYAFADEEPIWDQPLLDDILRTQTSVTLVGFYLGDDAFVVPIDAVREVIRFEEPYRLPKAPHYMPGVVNLRGRVLPVISLANLLLEEGTPRPEAPNGGLIILCEGKGLMIGLMIDRLHTMFKATQADINWNAEAHLGPSAELLCGLLETGEKLLGIVSVEKIVDKIIAD